MKKWIALLLAAVLCLSLVACGGKGSSSSTEDDTTSAEPEKSETEATLTKEEMLACAVEIDDYASEMAENKLRAEEKYIGNVFYVTGGVSNIQSDCVDVGDFTVSLPTEEIIQLSSGQRITVVGRIDSLTAEESQEMYDGWSFTNTTYHGVMSNAYFVNDTYELSGTLIFYYKDLYGMNGKLERHNYGNPDYWEFGLDMVDDNVIAVGYSMKEDIPVNHVMGENIDTITISGTELHNKDKITVSAKIFYDNGYILKDVELISVDN